jgi:hypothetical protein
VARTPRGTGVITLNELLRFIKRRISDLLIKTIGLGFTDETAVFVITIPCTIGTTGGLRHRMWASFDAVTGLVGA